MLPSVTGAVSTFSAGEVDPAVVAAGSRVGVGAGSRSVFAPVMAAVTCSSVGCSPSSASSPPSSYLTHFRTRYPPPPLPVGLPEDGFSPLPLVAEPAEDDSGLTHSFLHRDEGASSARCCARSVAVEVNCPLTRVLYRLAVAARDWCKRRPWGQLLLLLLLCCSIGRTISACVCFVGCYASDCCRPGCESTRGRKTAGSWSRAATRGRRGH